MAHDSALAFVSSPELAPLWLALHARLGAGGVVRSVTVALDPGGATADALANLLGWAERPRGSTVRVQLAGLEQALAHAGLPPAAELAAQLVGPLSDRRALREAAGRDRAALWEWLGGHPTVRRLGLQAWTDQVRAGGVIGSTGDTRRLLEAALEVMAELPADAEPLAVLAGRVLGDPHALDDGQRVAHLVLRAIALREGVEVPRSNFSRRELWDRAGVRTDELSATILLGGQWQPGTGIVAEVLQVAASHAQAVPVTLAMCRASDAPPPTRGVVHVVENPAVLAAALARLGTTCPPVACTGGWPSAAGLQVLTSLGSKAVQLRYHGDIDPDGLRIADYLVTKLGVIPWRLTKLDYLSALATRSKRTAPSVKPNLDPQRIPEVPWAPGLREAMAEHQVAVYEEQVVADLVRDLAEHSARLGG